ncbi:MAG: hypothetical protein H6741_04495 [Alphaproteobacteria bacterium]|nr:hypothetical protein [Alphaproteobacteria bacterium]
MSALSPSHGASGMGPDGRPARPPARSGARILTWMSAAFALVDAAIPVLFVLAFAIGWGALGLWDGDLGAAMGIWLGAGLALLLPPFVLMSAALGGLTAALSLYQGGGLPALLLLIVHGLAGLGSGALLALYSIPILG